MIPIYAAGTIFFKELERCETYLIRKHLLIPNDVRSDVVKNFHSPLKTTVAEMIKKLASKNRLFVPKDRMVLTKFCKASFEDKSADH